MRPIVLAILDGWGYSRNKVGNAIENAKTPTLDEITQNYPSTLIQASGPAVGMTFGEVGNSEVGHLTLGAGRVIFQYLTRVNKSIETGEFPKNKALLEVAGHVKQNNSTLHIAGLLTSGAVHAYFRHLVNLIEFADKNQLPYKLHLFTDGRDSGLKESVELIKELNSKFPNLQLGTVIGRDFAMNRTNEWHKTEATYKLLVNNDGTRVDNIQNALEDNFKNNVFDPNIPPLVVSDSRVGTNDGVIFFNFREDSMRQLVRVFVEKGFDMFLTKVPDNLFIAALTQYIESPDLHVLFDPPAINNNLAEVLSNNNQKHLHIAETEKYAHVTFFFNGLHNKPYPGETDFFIESVENATEHPQMRAMDIAQKVVQEIDGDIYEVFILNLANGDILAHFGNLENTIKGVEAVDEAVKVIKDKVLSKDGILLITSDHGNAESVTYTQTGEHETRHDPSPVPFYLIAKEYEKLRTIEQVEASRAQAQGLLADVAPTLLELMGIEKPVEMTGSSLLSMLVS